MSRGIQNVYSSPLNSCSGYAQIDSYRLELNLHLRWAGCMWCGMGGCYGLQDPRVSIVVKEWKCKILRLMGRNLPCRAITRVEQEGHPPLDARLPPRRLPLCSTKAVTSRLPPKEALTAAPPSGRTQKRLSSHILWCKGSHHWAVLRRRGTGHFMHPPLLQGEPKIDITTLWCDCSRGTGVWVVPRHLGRML